MAKIKSLLMKPFMGKKRSQKTFLMLQTLSLRGLNYGGGGDPTDSQELAALQYFLDKSATDGSLVVFDVGANVGVYANAALKLLGGRKAALHAFEPSKKTFERLRTNVRDSRATLHNFGFGEEGRQVTLYSNAEESGLASVYKRNLDHFGIDMGLSEQIQLKTIDAFCAENSIKHVHFLKMDVEGNEFNVLKGAKQMLDRGAIDCIQFEFGGCDIDSRTFFKDFFFLLNPRYRIHRILKDGLFPIDRYDELLEVFLTTNFLAERRR